MIRTLSTLALAGLAFGLGALVTTAPAGDKKDEKGFTELFDGKTLKGWKVVLQGKEAERGKTIVVEEGIIVVSGQPNGYIETEKSYRNYVVKYDWRYKRPAKLEDDEKFNGNSGLLVHIQGLPPKGTWPKCVEVQGMNKEHGKIFAIGGATGKFTFDAAALTKARNKVGEWNTTEVLCKDGEITSKVNGAQVATGKGELASGPFGLQSEGAEIHFKNIRIKVLD